MMEKKIAAALAGMKYSFIFLLQNAVNLGIGYCTECTQINPEKCRSIVRDLNVR